MLSILIYDCRQTPDGNEYVHPQTDMTTIAQSLGTFTIIDAKPESAFDCWLFLVEHEVKEITGLPDHVHQGAEAQYRNGLDNRDGWASIKTIAKEKQEEQEHREKMEAIAREHGFWSCDVGGLNVHCQPEDVGARPDVNRAELWVNMNEVA